MTPGANAYYAFNFPPTKFIVGESCASRERQALKIFEEWLELYNELHLATVDDYNFYDYDPIAAIEECYDTIVACETLLRSYSSDQLREAYDHLLKKNADRGYWIDFDYDFWASVLAGQRPAEKGSEARN